MLGKLIDSALKVKFAIWAVEKAAVKTHELKRYYRALLIGVMGAAAAGVLASLAVAAALVFLYQNLLMWEIDSLSAKLIIFAIVAALISLVVFFVRKNLDSSFIESTSGKTSHPDLLQDVIGGFLDGLSAHKK